MVIWIILAIAVVFTVMARYGDKPTELQADIWDADPDKRARNLKLAIAAWRIGRTYINPDRVHDIMTRAGAASGPIVIATPNAEERPRRLVRCCAMHKPHWE
jgi:hypothetical protein